VDAVDGSGSVVLLSGDAEAGKARLMREFATPVEAGGTAAGSLIAQGT
jgi:tRNA A37 threonylcarbamoyladenosine biosynthesis protein TsaE